MSENGPSNAGLSNFRFGVTVSALVVIALGILYGLGEVAQASMTDERLKATIILVSLGAEVTTIHYVITILRNQLVFKEKLEETHSIAFHACHVEPAHCYYLRGRPLPLCARHTGMYLSLFTLAITALVFPKFWIWLTNLLPWSVHLAVFLILLALVSVEGGLGKAGIIEQNKNIRALGGVATALGWAFFAMFLASFFGLFLGL